MATTNPLTVRRRPDISLAILIVGGIAYAMLCGPAIGRRGFPPIDDVWMGMTYLWVAPAALSALFDGGPFRSRRWHLVAYAFFTGFIDAATVGFMVPRHVTFLGALFLTILVSGPVHLIVTFALEWCLQRLLGIWRTFTPFEDSTEWLPQLSLVEYLVGYTIVATAIGFPFAYRHGIVAEQRVRGRQLAEDDWSNQSARRFATRHEEREVSPAKGVRVSFHFDRETGFRFKEHTRSSDLTIAYNARIDELVREDGIPAWSMNTRLISPEALVELLDSSEGTEIEAFPFEVTPSIVLFRTGTVARWGYTMSYQGDGGGVSSPHGGGGVSFIGTSAPTSPGTATGLAIATRVGNLLGVGGGPNPIFVIHCTDDTLCIRCGSNWIGLFHRDGRLLESAAR